MTLTLRTETVFLGAFAVSNAPHLRQKTFHPCIDSAIGASSGQQGSTILFPRSFSNEAILGPSFQFELVNPAPTPVADAGPNQTVTEGDMVTLDGTSSTGIHCNVLDYAWTQTGGPDVTLDLSDPAQPTFSAPDVDLAVATLTFELVVNNSESSSAADMVIITVENSQLCGNGTTEPPEICDDGNTMSGDGCRDDCTQEVCGDSILDPGETCDTGGESATCNADCTMTVCGDGIPNQAAGEQCDDGNTTAGDGCRDDCTQEACGDGILDPNEACDDGNQEDDDNCSSTCTHSCAGLTPTDGCRVNGQLNQPCIGTDGDDLIIGTLGNDVIIGLAGEDTLKGRSGEDILCGNAGDDLLLAGSGNDELEGDNGDDVLKGEAGDDLLLGGPDDDLLIGGGGNDEIIGDAGEDKLIGNDGDDMLDGGSEADILDGGTHEMGDMCDDPEGGSFNHCES